MIPSDSNINWRFDLNDVGCAGLGFATRDDFLVKWPDDCLHEAVGATLEDSNGKIYASAYIFYYKKGENYHRENTGDRNIIRGDF